MYLTPAAGLGLFFRPKWGLKEIPNKVLYPRSGSGSRSTNIRGRRIFLSTNIRCTEKSSCCCKTNWSPLAGNSTRTKRNLFRVTKSWKKMSYVLTKCFVMQINIRLADKRRLWHPLHIPKAPPCAKPVTMQMDFQR
jgi:hypothetical protein